MTTSASPEPPEGQPPPPSAPPAEAPPAAASAEPADAAGDGEEAPPASLLRENVEAIIVAFVLALLIRQYAVEAFVIPTGSMAPTLLGAHVDIVCPNCGREQPASVQLDYENAGLTKLAPNYRATCPHCGTVTSVHIEPEGSKELQCSNPACNRAIVAEPIPDVHGDRLATRWCPNCGVKYDAVVDARKWPSGDVSRGDRILVDKLSYHIAPPRRFEVAVFKYPKQPTENYIKRLIGLPGETIDVRDGDIFVDGKIARKPDALQEQLWRSIHDSNLVEKSEGSAHAEGSGEGSPGPAHRSKERRKAWRPLGGRWEKIDGGRGWKGEAPAAPASGDDAAAWLVYDRPIRDENTYNEGEPGTSETMAAGTHPVGDVRIRFRAKPLSPSARLLARIAVDAVPVDVEVGGGAPPRFALRGGQELAVTPRPAGGASAGEVTVDLQRVDAELILLLDGEVAGRVKLDDAPHEPEVRSVEVRFGVRGGAAEFRDVGLYKDIYYLEKAEGPNSFPFHVPEGQYFFLGDNSPSSRDGRAWGTVPASHLVGRAFMVFWPAVPGDFAIRRIR